MEVSITNGDNIPRIRDDNNQPLPIKEKVKLQVHLLKKVETVTFYVAERLAAPIILGCNFCGKHIEAITPRQRAVKMYEGTFFAHITLTYEWFYERRSPRRKHICATKRADLQQDFHILDSNSIISFPNLGEINNR